ncbi:MAG: Re/Si-specific NAD(P)(+) transhydrogenase subunit alpha [Proteobacteria bacterium]|nr:Re/Si-specific NAD(P)(+) transhydrogenase subunit alpha [Pseudomonadota bacterium]
MKIGVLKQTAAGETRVAMTPDSIKRLMDKCPGVEIVVEKGAGDGAFIADDAFKGVGAKVGTTKQAWEADVVLTIHPPKEAEVKNLKKGALLIGLLDPHGSAKLFAALAKAGVNAASLELIPRTSRAQAMDVLSSQANIGGYRAVLEAATHLPKFFPMMMTAAGSAKAAKVIVLGAGVAGLQAIATARRLGAIVEAFDVRPEVKEQIESLGAKFIDIDLGETGAGSGGYAKELSADAKKKQQAALQERLKGADAVITTALIPGRPAPVLVTADTVKGMVSGSVIVDMAAANGGNCELSKANKVVVEHGVTIIGHTNYPAMMPRDASLFYGRNVLNLLQLLLKVEGKASTLNLNLEDDIVAGCLAVHDGAVRFGTKK